MCSREVLTKLRRWIQASSAIIWMSIHLSPPKNNHLNAHLRIILMLSKMRWWSLSRLGLLRKFFYLEWLANTIVCVIIEQVWKTVVHHMHYALLSKSNKLAKGRWRFPLKSRKVPFCGRKFSLKSQSGIVLFRISDTGRKPNPQDFAQSHIKERRPPPLPYKQLV